MSTYTQILYQIVFSTKHRERTLKKPSRTELFAYMSGILRAKKCVVYVINGIEDHLHIVTHLHPSVALSSVVKDIKLSSTKFIKENLDLDEFNGWQDGYSAFTYSISARRNLIRYVENQESHHRSKTYLQELQKLLQVNQVHYDERFLK